MGAGGSGAGKGLLAGSQLLDGLDPLPGEVGWGPPQEALFVTRVWVKGRVWVIGRVLTYGQGQNG